MKKEDKVMKKLAEETQEDIQKKSSKEIYADCQVIAERVRKSLKKSATGLCSMAKDLGNEELISKTKEVKKEVKKLDEKAKA